MMSLRWGLLGGVVLSGVMATGVGAVEPTSVGWVARGKTQHQFTPSLGFVPQPNLQQLEPPQEWLIAQNAEVEEALRLYQEGRELFDQGTAESLRAAIEKFATSIALLEARNEGFSEAIVRYWSGFAHLNLGYNREALAQYEKAIVIFAAAAQQATGENLQTAQTSQATTLKSMGLAYYSLGEKNRALEHYNQALTLYRVVGDRGGEANTLNGIGLVYDSLGEKSQALEHYNQALPLRQAEGDRRGEAVTLNNIGGVYDSLGEKSRALEYYEQALPLLRAVGDRRMEATILNNIGLVYDALGEKQQALDYYNQALPISQAVGDRGVEARVLNNIGSVYDELGKWKRALDYFERALPISQAVGDPYLEAGLLSNIGLVYSFLEEHNQALEYYNQALPLARVAGSRTGEAATLNNIGLAYEDLGEVQRALEFYNHALPLYKAVGNREELSITLNNIGRIFAAQNQPEVAIIFLKESVRTRETIRTDNRELDEQLRQSYITTIEDDYRFLADLLLEQARIPEAQQVLDLLKLQELRDFTNTRASFTSDGDIAYTDPEQAVLDDHNSLIALGTEILSCEDSNCNDLDRLYDQLEGLKAQYDEQVAQFIATIRTNRANDDVFQDLDNLSSEAEDLLIAYNQAGQNTVLIYPFVLEDKLWLVWAAAGGVIGSIEIPVSQAELATTVQRLGNQLKRDGSLSRLQATSQQLYDWIIKPLESELVANDIDHLVFVNDRVTRYIPMAALYDGEQYLLEKYTISSVLAPALTDTTNRFNTSETNILGMGLTDAVSGFNPLPAVKDELNAIVTQGDDPGVYPGQVLLNEQFTLDSLKTNVSQHNVLHLATHATFVPGRAEESYIVLGDGGSLKVADIEAMERRLRNLQLVVLSACQTALGGEAGDGTEIAGISSYFLEKGRAETVIASLWSVNDQSTSVLMQRFYALLATEELTTAEALRQAQLSLLYREETADFETRVADSRSLVSVRPRNGSASGWGEGFSNPYYWSPFILIGNGL